MVDVVVLLLVLMILQHLQSDAHAKLVIQTQAQARMSYAKVREIG